MSLRARARTSANERARALERGPNPSVAITDWNEGRESNSDYEHITNTVKYSSEPTKSGFFLLYRGLSQRNKGLEFRVLYSAWKVFGI